MQKKIRIASRFETVTFYVFKMEQYFKKIFKGDKRDTDFISKQAFLQM